MRRVKELSNVSFLLYILALLVANWTAVITYTTTTSLWISWRNLSKVLDKRILHYIVVIKSANGTIMNGNIRSEQTLSDVFSGLSIYTEYRLGVVGVDERGAAYKLHELTAWTDESGKLPKMRSTTVFHTNWNVTMGNVSVQFSLTRHRFEEPAN